MTRKNAQQKIVNGKKVTYINNEPNWETMIRLAMDIVKESKIKPKDFVIEMLELGRASYQELQKINNKDGE